MRTHNTGGQPIDIESLFTMLEARLLPLVALAYAIVEGNTGPHADSDERAAKALAEGIIAFEEDLEDANAAALKQLRLGLGKAGAA